MVAVSLKKKCHKNHSVIIGTFGGIIKPTFPLTFLKINS